MKNSTLLLLLFVVTGFSGLCSPPADEDVSPPEILLEVKGLELQKDNPDEGGEWNICVKGMGIRVPGWNIDWCEEEEACMTVSDSTGRKAPKVQFVSWVFVQQENRVRVFLPEWMPSARSQWVAVKGEVPFVVSCREAVTPPVVVKLAEGASVPLVLKEAAMGKDGSPVDVNATLVVTKYKDVGPAGGEYKKVLELAMRTEFPVSLRNIELKTTDGMPVKHSEWTWGRLSRSWGMEKVEEGKLQVSVRYSQGLRKCRAVIDGKASLAGFSMGKNGWGAHGGRKADGAPLPVRRIADEQTGRCVGAELIGLSIENESREKEETDSPQMLFDVELSVNRTAVFGSSADMKKQSLPVTDSTGRTLSPAMFNLTSLTSEYWKEGLTILRCRGKVAEFASPGAEWLRIQGTLHVPVATMQESPVYELPLLNGAKRQIPIPGATSAGGDGVDVLVAEDAPSCQLSLENVKEQEHGGVRVTVAVEVEGVPFDLECFELVDGNDVPLKNIESAGTGHSFSPEDQKSSWYQNFKIGSIDGMEKLRVRLKYKANMETVDVPVDCKIGLGGLLP